MFKIIGAAYYSDQDESVSKLEDLPEFRRSTLAMRLSVAACTDVFSRANISNDERQQIPVLLGTSYGELESTKDFLKDWYKLQVARPLLFQNSLHNSILGFLSIQLNLRGAGMTFSNGEQTPRDLIEHGQVIMQDEKTDYCLVCHVDSYMEQLRSELQGTKAIPLMKEGASALLLAKNQNAKSVTIPTQSHFYKLLN